jgi:hypothetical protein
MLNKVHPLKPTPAGTSKNRFFRPKSRWDSLSVGPKRPIGRDRPLPTVCISTAQKADVIDQHRMNLN